MKTNIKKDLEEIIKILVEMEHLKNSIKELTNEKEEYFDLVVKKSHFYHKVYVNYVKVFVIDVYKLMAEREAYNFKNLLKKCIDNTDESSPDKNLTNIKFRNLLKDFESIYDKYFQMIKEHRNKYYAHTDRNKEKYEFGYPTEELFEILCVFQKIYSALNEYYNNKPLFVVLDNKPNEIIN